jgi:Gluconate 2-dehydrogenase subunit 3
MASELQTTPDVGAAGVAPAASAALLADVIDVLLPGDESWPSARIVGVQAFVAVRLLEERGKAAFPKLMSALLAAGGPFDGLDETARVEVVKKFEQRETELFGWLRDAAYVAYYENPFVAEVINTKGHRYELRPHVKGYPLPRFDPARHTPRHGRGRYTPTEQVRPVDTSKLDLGSDRTVRWGLDR